MVHPFSWTKCRLLGCARPWCQPMHLLPSTFFLSLSHLRVLKIFLYQCFFFSCPLDYLFPASRLVHWKHSCLLDFLCRNTKKLCISSFLRGNIRKLLKPVGLIFFKGDIFWVPTPKNQFLRENCKKIYKRRTKILAVSSTTLSPQLDFCDVDCWSILIVLARLGSGWSHTHTCPLAALAAMYLKTKLAGQAAGAVSCVPALAAPCAIHIAIFIYISIYPAPIVKVFARVWKKTVLVLPPPGRHTHLCVDFWHLCHVLLMGWCASHGRVLALLWRWWRLFVEDTLNRVRFFPPPADLSKPPLFVLKEYVRVQFERWGWCSDVFFCMCPRQIIIFLWLRTPIWWWQVYV